MDFTDDPVNTALRRELRDFFRGHLTHEARRLAEEDSSEIVPGLYEAMAAAGYVGLAIPAAFGGQEKGFRELAIVAEEAARAEVPAGLLGLYNFTAGFAAAAILRLGDEKLKQSHLPLITAGEYRFAQGLTEPDAGSDLAAVKFEVRPAGDELVLSGQKTFNFAHLATHMIVLGRSNPNEKRHRGLSLAVLDLRAPRVTITPMYTMRGARVNVVTCDDVRASRDALLGEVDKGWYALMSVIDKERANVDRVVSVELLLSKVIDHVQGAVSLDGVALAESPAMRAAIVDAYMDILQARLLSYEVSWLQDRGEDVSARVSVAKTLHTDMVGRVVNRLMDVLGPRSVVQWANAEPESKQWSILDGLLVRMYQDARIWTIAGGTREIQRNIIAQRILGLPRS